MADHDRKSVSQQFNDVGKEPDRKQETIRDKDNASPRHEPRFRNQPAPNLAPAGTVGIKRDLPSPQAAAPKRFSVKPGNLTKEFVRHADLDLTNEQDIEH